MHPRSKARIDGFGFGGFLDDNGSSGILAIEPLGYLQFLHLNMNARLILTDSGGLQEETTVLGVPCLTLRENTERPVTIEEGTNRLLGTDPEAILAAIDEVHRGDWKTGSRPPLWDGQAAPRIAQIIDQFLARRA